MESLLPQPPSSRPTPSTTDSHLTTSSVARTRVGADAARGKGSLASRLSFVGPSIDTSQWRSRQRAASPPVTTATSLTAAAKPTVESARAVATDHPSLSTAAAEAAGSSNGRSQATTAGTTATTATTTQSASPWARLLMVTMLVQALVVSSLEASVAILLFPTQEQAPPPLTSPDARNPPAPTLLAEPNRPAPFNVRMRSVPVYAALFACAQLYSMFLAYDATRHENVIQLVALVLFNAAIVVYAIFQSITQLHPLDIGLLLRSPSQTATGVGLSLAQIDYILAVGYSLPALATYFTVVVALIAWRLYKEFPFSVYKKIGADRVIQAMYRTYLVLITVLRVDLFFVSAFAVQYLVLVASLDLMDAMSMTSSVNVVDAIIVGGASLIMLLLMWLVPYAISHEHCGLLASSMVGVGGVASALVYKLMYIFQNRTMPVFLGVWRFLLFFGILSLVLLLCTAIIMILCARNFGNGLQAAFDKLDVARLEYALAEATPSQERRQLPPPACRRPTTWPTARPSPSAEANPLQSSGATAAHSVHASSGRDVASNQPIENYSFSRMLPPSASSSGADDPSRNGSLNRHTLASTDSPFYALYGLSCERADTDRHLLFANDSVLGSPSPLVPQSPLESVTHPWNRRVPPTSGAAGPAQTVHDHLPHTAGASSSRQGPTQANVAGAWLVSSFPA